MLTNYLKSTLRNLRKHLGYTIINVVGLTIGLTGSLVIYNVLQYETNFDNFHSKADQVYKVVQNNHTAEGTQYWNTTAYPLAEALRNDFPAIEVTQAAGPVQRIISSNDGQQVRRFEVEKILFVDSVYLQIFDFKKEFSADKPFWLQGNVSTAFDLKNSVVLTKSIAELYFPDIMRQKESLLGQKLLLNNKDELIVTGLVADPPGNTNLLFDMMISYEFFKKHNPYPTGNWSGNYQGSTYVKLPQSYPPELLVGQFDEFKGRHLNENDNKRIEYNLISLNNLHTDNQYGSSIGSYIISDEILIGLGVMAFFLLLIACVNYINLATVQASKRSREVGIRKVLGSSRSALIYQFFLETLVLAVISAIHAYVISDIVLKYLNQQLDVINFDIQMYPNTLWFLLGVVFLVSVLGSLYPALSLSGFHPVKALKSNTSRNFVSDKMLRNALVIIQFAIVQLLIIGTFVVREQMQYFSNKDLGFDKEAVVVTNLPMRDKNTLDRYHQQLLQHPNIEQVSFSSGIPAEPDIQYGTTFRFTHEPPEMQRETEMKMIDLEYQDMYGLEIIAGQWLNNSHALPQGFNGFVVNETLVSMLNSTPEDIIGKDIQINEGPAPVVGVVRDFNNQDLHESISPCVMLYWGPGFLGEAGIKLSNTQEVASTLKHIETVWASNFTDKIYQYEFIDDYLAKSYHIEAIISSAFLIATVLAVTIGCLGLYGLISFITTTKTKEIGVRKVLGASISSLVHHLSKELAALLLVSIGVGSFSGWYIMNQWLENFSYKTEIGIGVFVISTMSTIIVALLTTSLKTIKAASANPVDSLRYE